MNDVYYELPPMGQADADYEAKVVGHLRALVDEAAGARQPFDQQVQDNINLFYYGDTSKPGPNEIVVHEIQNAIVAATDIQTKEPPTVTLDPVETGEPGEYYWGGPDIVAQQLVAIGVLQPEQVAPSVDPSSLQTVDPQPIDPLTAGILKGQSIPEEVMPALPPGFIRPDWLVHLCDRTVADTYQSVHDVYWRRSQADLWVRKNLLDTNIQGWTWGLYQFDDNAKKHVLKHLPITQVYVDPTVADIADAQYCGFDLPLDVNEAKVAYPDLAAVIDELGRVGHVTPMDGQADLSSTYTSVDFKRKMIILRVFWIRNQLIPVTQGEALALGEVEQQEIPDESPDMEGVAGGLSDAAPQMEAGSAAGDSAEVRDSSSLPSVQATRSALIHRETGQEVDPTHPLWPTKVGIRQIMILATGGGSTGTVVRDAECEFWDIPIVHNVNIPIPGQRPWGQGEPERLKCLQQAESRTLGSMVDHADYFAHPTCVISQSTRDALGPLYEKGKIRPGLTFTIDDELYKNANGNIEMFQYPPAMTQALPDVFGILQQTTTSQSGHAEVLQGRAQAQVKSGRAIELLQSSASSMIGFKSQRTGDMLTRLAELMLHSLVWRLEPADVRKIVSKYPDHIIQKICERARMLDWDISVTVQTGSTMQAQRRAAAMEDLQAGKISDQTYWEETGRDPRVEEARILDQMRRQSQMMSMAMPQQQEGQEQEQQGRTEQAPPN